MALWKRSEQHAFLRAIDGVTAILVTPAGREPAGRLVAERLVAFAFSLLAVSDAEEEARPAGAHLASLAPRDTADEASVRRWLHELVRARAEEANATLSLTDRGWWIDLRDHDAWPLLELGPLARRIRLWAATRKLGATALGRAIGVPAHQVGAWATGRSRPRAEHRVALAGVLGVHPAWLSAARDLSADSDLLLYRACACGSGAALAAGRAQRSAYTAEEVSVVWCEGCVIGSACSCPLSGLRGDTRTAQRRGIRAADPPYSGSSIGTRATFCSQRGYRCFGVDQSDGRGYDPSGVRTGAADTLGTAGQPPSAEGSSGSQCASATSASSISGGMGSPSSRRWRTAVARSSLCNWSSSCSRGASSKMKWKA